MDFGKRQLEKYGWKEGKGLGKKEDGLSKPIKPKLKFDNHGVGFNLGDQYKNNWWELMYNKAASSLLVQNTGNASATCEESLDKKPSTSSELYGSFLRTARLTQDGLEDLEMNAEDHLEASENAFFRALTDDELFSACNGRTAHKGARHGLKQSGKLSRIEKQEKMLLKKLRNVSLSDDEYVIKKKVKKLSKHKEMCLQKSENDKDELDSLSSCSSNTSHKKKRKKNLRRVSFNELVTEYHNPEPESSPKSVQEEVIEPVIVEARIRDDNDNEINNPVEQDEGIEQDFEESEDHADAGHGSFEEPQAYALDKLSKKERKLLKKKRKLERKSGATVKFLEEMDLKQDWEGVSDYASGKCKKRKLKNDLLKLDEVVSKKLHSEYENLERLKNDFGKFEESVEAAQKRKDKSKKSKKKAEKRQAKQINSIVESMNQVCKISDTE